MMLWSTTEEQLAQLCKENREQRQQLQQQLQQQQQQQQQQHQQHQQQHQQHQQQATMMKRISELERIANLDSCGGKKRKQEEGASSAGQGSCRSPDADEAISPVRHSHHQCVMPGCTRFGAFGLGHCCTHCTRSAGRKHGTRCDKYSTTPAWKTPMNDSSSPRTPPGSAGQLQPQSRAKRIELVVQLDEAQFQALAAGWLSVDDEAIPPDADEAIPHIVSE